MCRQFMPTVSAPISKIVEGEDMHWNTIFFQCHSAYKVIVPGMTIGSGGGGPPGISSTVYSALHMNESMNA